MSVVPTAPRYLALDGLRGVAATSVLVFHLFWNAAEGDLLRDALPTFINDATGLLRSGVAIFFVISGFVIALTTINMRSPSQGGRFILRRQVRLDPPYYVALVAALGIEFAQRFVAGLESRTFSLSDVVLNFFYLQGVTDRPSVLAVAWTLCLEVQFYLVVLLLSLAAGRLFGAASQLAVVMFGTAVLTAFSIALPFTNLQLGAWVIGTWWMFALGMFLAWFAAERLSWPTALCAIASIASWVVILDLTGRGDPYGGEWFAVGTAVVIAALVRARRLGSSPGRVLLHLGRLSYSLYLVHLPVIAVVSGLGGKVAPGTVPAQLAVPVVAGVGSVVCAEVLHRSVELPAMAWSRRLRPVAHGRAQVGSSG